MTARAHEFVSRGFERKQVETAGEFFALVRGALPQSLNATPNARACHPSKAADPRVAVTVDQLVKGYEPTCRVCRALLEEARREAAR